MKKVILLLTLFALTTTTIFAQGRPEGPPPGERGRRQITPEQRVERLADMLLLTKDQEAELLVFMQASETAKKDELDAVDTREEKREIHLEYAKLTDEKMETLLTEDQKKTYARMKARMQERRKERRGQRPRGRQ